MFERFCATMEASADLEIRHLRAYEFRKRGEKKLLVIHKNDFYHDLPRKPVRAKCTENAPSFC